MPAAAPLIAAAVANVTASFTITGIITSLATSLVMSGLQRLIMGKPSKPRGGSSAIQNTGITTQVKQPIMTRKPTYGEMRRSGGILYIGMSSNNDFLHLVVEVAPHEIDSIGEIWLNDYSIPVDHLDGSGVVNTGRYDGLVRIKKHLGTDAQTADSDLVSEVSEWTTNHRLRGIAYIYIRLEWDEDKFPTGVPNVSAWIKGKKVYDPRTTTTVFNPNVALVLNDYLEDTEFGLGAATSEIDQTALIAAANSSDEFVTVTSYDETVSSVDASGDLLEILGDKLFVQRGDRVRIVTTGTAPGGLSTGVDYYVIPYQRTDTLRIMLATTYANALSDTQIDITDAGTGTHTIRKNAEPRYTGAITINTDGNVSDNIKDILSGMAGLINYTGGVYRMLSGSFQTPTIFFNENDLFSAYNVKTKVSKRERFNTVRGVYVSPINAGESSDYPQITNSTYITEDGETIVRQVDMPITQRPHTAQRIAKVNLEISRQEITWSADFSLKALQVVAGDNAYFTVAAMGWTDKVFQIKNWKLTYTEEDGVVIPVVHMEMREIASAVYDWNNGEETAVDPAPNTTLPNAFDVSAPTSLVVTPQEITTAENDKTYKFKLDWTAPADGFVTTGGKYEIQFKKSAETDYLPSYFVDGALSSMDVNQVQPGINYDVRIRAINYFGVKSAFSALTGFTIESPSGATVQLDYQEFVGPTGTIVDSFDYGEFSDSVSDSLDYGEFV